MKNSYINIILKITLVIILLQTLFFKFTASPESVYIFSKLNAESVGRISSGIIEPRLRIRDRWETKFFNKFKCSRKILKERIVNYFDA